MFSTYADSSIPRDRGDRENGGATKRKRPIAADSLDKEIRIVGFSQPNDVYDNKKNEAPPRPKVRILTRRYSLTKTGYKYLDVGITAKPPSYVDIVLGDSHGKEISLSPDTWRELVERKNTVLSSLRSNIDETHVPAPLSIGNLTLRFGKINNLPILRLDTTTTRLAMSLCTVLAMYDLQCCVDRIVSTLNAAARTIDETYSRFLNVADSVKEGSSASRAIRDSEIFDRGNIIDCEIAALCF